MFITEPEPTCSKCGARSSETFIRRDVSGVRCLRCGHEKIAPRPERQNETAFGGWSTPKDRNQF